MINAQSLQCINEHARDMIACFHASAVESSSLSSLLLPLRLWRPQLPRFMSFPLRMRLMAGAMAGPMSNRNPNTPAPFMRSLIVMGVGCAAWYVAA